MKARSGARRRHARGMHMWTDGIMDGMNASMETGLKEALERKELDRTAYDEIIKWLTEEEFAEFVPEIEKRVAEGAWEFLMDAFYRTVLFGTGGIRGVMDIGTNRINNHTIRWASQAYAQYLLNYKSEDARKGVAIAYDSRINSDGFMKETAGVLAANGIPVYVFPYYRATPELSFAVRHRSLGGGIVISASHNPPQFNGYKVYDAHGVQVLPDEGLLIEKEFNASASAIKKMTFDDAVAKGLVHTIEKETDDTFIEAAKGVSLRPLRDVRIAYSPLHGVGSQSVLPALKGAGFGDIAVVEEQMALDGRFPTVKGHFPNPEFPAVYEQVIALAKERNADIAIVSDPDADRLGVAAPDAQGEWHVLTGNQTASLLVHFAMEGRVEAGTMPPHPVIIKTSVTTDLVRDIAERFGAEVIGDLLVGFKFIGDRLEHLSPERQFIAGCEESCGYLFGTAYRDKGAETPAVIAAEMAAWCKTKGMTVMDLLESVYARYGYYSQRLYSREIEGLGAFDRMNLAMKKLRAALPKEIGGVPVVKVMDRLTGEVRNGADGALLESRNWDHGDMLSFFLSADERTALHIRPSGTEPKMKYYTAVRGTIGERTKEDVDREAEAIERAGADLFEKILAETPFTVG